MDKGAELTCTHKQTDLKCVTCCARLLANVPASQHKRAHQEGILEVIKRQKGAPLREAVLNELRELRLLGTSRKTD